MEENRSPIDLGSKGLDHAPLVRGVVLEVPAATLKDNTALLDRLGRAAAARLGLEDVTASPALGRAAQGALWSRTGPVWAACEVNGDQGRIVDIRPAPGPGRTRGLAVDVGSTTLVLALVDLDAPAETARLTLSNPQAAQGADILTRLHYADKAEGHRELTNALREAINRGATDLARSQGLDPADIAAAAVSGNTAMTHFFLDLPTGSLIREPYVPILNRPRNLTARDVGLAIAPEAPVWVMPGRGAYFGGDLISGLVASGLSRAEEPCFLVDVGTNAEVVLGQKDWLVGAAGAAGPALEGGVSSRGMPAGPGAVDRVRIDRETREPSWRVMGDGPPTGICGSGLIDLFAEMFLSGVIDLRGRIVLPEGHPRRVETDEGPGYLLVPGPEAAEGRPITISEVELDILIRSKAAMYTILNTVLMNVGLTFADVDRFFVAGTFGQYIDPRMAVAVGMLPDLPLSRFVPLGNSSLTGAVLALVSGRARREAIAVWKKLTYLEMNVNQDLMNRFSAARFIPHTDRALFPSVGATIR